MNNDKLKFVVDSRSFDGSCVTTMSDGIHGDYHHETLEELRDREKNPYLIAVSGNTVRKMIRIYLQSLCAPFSEITEERYFDYIPAVLIPSAVLRSASELLSARLHFLLTQRNRTVRLFPAVCPAAETFLHSAPFQHTGAQTVPGAVP